MRRFFSLASFALLLVALSTQAQGSLYNLPEPFANPVAVSSAMTQTGLGRIITANNFVDSVTILALDRSGIEAEIDVGADPRSVFVTPDNMRLLATSYAEGLLSVIDLEEGAILAQYPVGSQPYHVVATNELAYVSLQGEAAIAVVDLASGDIRATIPTPPVPAALALWGDFLYVTHFWTGELSLIYLPAAEVVRTIQTHPQASLSQAIEVDPFSGRAFLPQSISNNTATNATPDNRLIPMLHIVDLSTMIVEQSINLIVADRNVSMPFAVKQPQNRARLYIAHAGSNAVTVLDLDTGIAADHFQTGANPRALLFNGNSTQVITFDAVDVSVNILDTAFFEVVDTIPTSATFLPAQEQIGLRLLHTATDERLSRNGLMACAACHFGSQSDGRAWDATLTPPLSGLGGIVPDALNQHIRQVMGGNGFDAEGLDMQALIQTLLRDE